MKRLIAILMVVAVAASVWANVAPIPKPAKPLGDPFVIATMPTTGFDPSGRTMYTGSSLFAPGTQPASAPVTQPKTSAGG